MLKNRITLIISKIQLEAKVKAHSEPVREEEEINSELNARKRELEDECPGLKKEIDDLETLVKSEKEKHSSEQKVTDLIKIETINDDVETFNSDIRATKEAHQQALDEVQAEGDILSTPSKTNYKAEQEANEISWRRLCGVPEINTTATMSSLEGFYEQEEKIKMDLEWKKEKLERDLDLSRESIMSLEIDRHQLDEKLEEKELGIGLLNSDSTDESNLFSQFQKMMRKLQARSVELEEELEAKKTTPAKVERQRSELARELEEMTEQLEEARGTSLVQLENNKKREAKFIRLRRDLDKATFRFDTTAATIRRKHEETLEELKGQVDNLHMVKQILEKEKSELKLEVDGLLTSVEHMAKAKSKAEKLCKLFENQLTETNVRLEEMAILVNDVTTQKSKLESEKDDFTRQLEEKDNLINKLFRGKNNFVQQIEELRMLLEQESESKKVLTHALQSAKHDYDLLKGQYREEQEAKAKLLWTLTKGRAEVVQWRTHYETHTLQRNEDFEEAKKKLAFRLQEAGEAIQEANAKSTSLEMTKQRLQLELKDVVSDLEKVHCTAAFLDEKQRNFDKVLNNWKEKYDNSQAELEVSQIETQSISEELFKLKQAYKEITMNQEALKRENENLHEEISDLTDQIREGNKNLCEMEKVKRLAEREKSKAKVALEKAEGVLEREENKILYFQYEILEAKVELERKLVEKEEEIESLRRDQQRTIDSLQSTLDFEVKSQAEASRLKKKMEGDLSEMEVQLSHANRQTSEASKSLCTLQKQIKNLQMQVDETTHQNEGLKEKVMVAERQNAILRSELDELQSLQEQTERGRRLAEQELLEATEKLNMLHTQNTGLLTLKKKWETDTARIKKELEDAIEERQSAEEKAKKAITDAALLSENLKKEQYTCTHLERIRTNMEQSIMDLKKRLEDAEQSTLKGGNKHVQKLESKISELENKLECEVRRSSEAQNGARKFERSIMELTYQAEEDKKNLNKMQTLIDKLQLKVKSYKHQVEAVEAQANQYLYQFKTQQCELDNAKERAEAAETQIKKLRVKTREIEKKIYEEKQVLTTAEELETRQFQNTTSHMATNQS
ncbi:myosin-15 [Antechinus flavipes]|uniref:myosin-15 n=1 Tax=Antechinus flavipes TaxID=38775 RepID=UPI002235FA60|nr:myosin-15 [Antechinus flavipes]